VAPSDELLDSRNLRGHIDLDTQVDIYIYIYYSPPYTPPYTPLYPPPTQPLGDVVGIPAGAFLLLQKMTSLEISDMYFYKFEVCVNSWSIFGQCLSSR
jgi:hypothetical protein